MAFAQNGLSFRLIEDAAFKDAFGVQIPKGLGRKEFAHATTQLKENTLEHLISR